MSGQRKNFQSGHIVSKGGNWGQRESSSVWAVAEPGLLEDLPTLLLDLSSAGVDSVALDNLLSLSDLSHLICKMGMRLDPSSYESLCKLNEEV